ncbi:MAG TPA: NAD(P)-dependent alcohol dehydrogenase [Nitrososphaerales archaeon]|nr:NAD(P)-dependent alcohol dehydrogenase [Nitrososphaerales archaeon]
MKAIVRPRYGSPDVLQLKEVEKPAPADNQVLVKVYAASINKSDYYALGESIIMRLLGGGVRRPKDEKIGSDVAGRVEAVGKNVTQFRPGDEVFGDAHGAYAEYVCAREGLLALKPGNVTFEEAAAVPVAAITALQGLRDKGRIQAGQKVAIDGASGGVGTFAVQIAKSYGAEVTAVCSTGNVESVRKMGAARVIDYTKEDFTKGGDKYDLILGVNGNRSIFGYRRALGPKGIYVMAGGSNPLRMIVQTAILGKLMSRSKGRKLGFMGIAKLNQKDLVVLKELMEAGRIKPLVDRRYPLGETAEAMRYLGEGHAKGKVVITVEHSN